jgi:hypothetical protein
MGSLTRRDLSRLVEQGLAYLAWLVLPLAFGIVITLTLWAAL